MSSIALDINSLMEAEEALRLLRSLPLGRAVHSITLSDKEHKVSSDLFARILLQCPNVRSLSLHEWKFKRISTSHIQQFAAQSTFSCLTCLVIGFKGALASSSLFALLSAMPSLSILRIGYVEDHLDDSDDEDGDTKREETRNARQSESFATPACSLTRLLVLDDWGINFMHYRLLLSKSHDTLEHLELSWIFDWGSDSDSDTDVVRPVDIENAILQAIAPCSRLRNLAIVGSDFTATRLIAACPNLQRLSLERAPSDEEIAALPHIGRTLRELYLLHCTGAGYGGDGFIGVHWPALERFLPSLPALRTLRFIGRGAAAEKSPLSYPLARAECERRCIQLLTK
ncbi:hypothetical protein EXIGLDRAFT_765679 [Exidia glandulosa HHB12029]|uniref:F-box domain-containing protein n=1 Tax=Exidia glandulosa HHB12029 TaxID=1314781 RepID=A0A165K961_EXIGL|nr:hypothetical protein EXIGLDRAFT_765679 [Exidia glandulosa HHB12029]